MWVTAFVLLGQIQTSTRLEHSLLRQVPSMLVLARHYLWQSMILVLVLSLAGRRRPGRRGCVLMLVGDCLWKRGIRICRSRCLTICRESHSAQRPVLCRRTEVAGFGREISSGWWCCTRCPGGQGYRMLLRRKGVDDLHCQCNRSPLQHGLFPVNKAVTIPIADKIRGRWILGAVIFKRNRICWLG